VEFLTESRCDYTGVGVFIHFSHEKGIVKFKIHSDSPLNGVILKSSEFKISADSILFFKNGPIYYLEIWSFDGKYPEKELTEYELTEGWKGSPDEKLNLRNI